MRACDALGYFNPESQHQFGQRARRRLEAARENTARMLGARLGSHRSDRLIFTSGGTEANNLAIRGLVGDAPGHVLVSAIEHPSVLGPAEHLERRGFTVERLPVTELGIVTPDALSLRLRDDTRLVSVMFVNNETGVVQRIAELAELCQSRGVPLHTDAVQAIGKVPVDFHALNVAALTFTAHKFHGPRGIGGLLLRHDITPKPLLFGGFQQFGVRPGTESVTAAVGLETAVTLARDVSANSTKLRSLRDRFESLLLAAVPELFINGAEGDRAPHISNIAFVGVDRQVLAVALDLVGVACSTGSACASGSTDPSHVLVAMGVPDAVFGSSLRFSFGSGTTCAEVDLACERITKTVNDLRSRKSS